MKKLVILSLLSVALLSSCGNGAKNEAMKAQNDSLMVEMQNWTKLWVHLMRFRKVSDK